MYGIYSLQPLRIPPTAVSCQTSISLLAYRENGAYFFALCEWQYHIFAMRKGWRKALPRETKNTSKKDVQKNAVGIRLWRRFIGSPLVSELPDGFTSNANHIFAVRKGWRKALPRETKKHIQKGCVFCFWWGKVDSNHRSKLQQIYSLSPLATREFPQTRGIILYSAGFVNRFLKNIFGKTEYFFTEKKHLRKVGKKPFLVIGKIKKALAKQWRVCYNEIIKLKGKSRGNYRDC